MKEVVLVTNREASWPLFWDVGDAADWSRR